MGWAEIRIEEYRRGSPATWLERRSLEHANPWHLAIGLVALVGCVAGLWTHDWVMILGSLALSLVGHVYCWTRIPATTRTGGEVNLRDLTSLKPS